MNPFAFLEVEEVNESTKNPQRKLAKMKRRYSDKPSHDLKLRIDEMDSRFNPIQKKKKFLYCLKNYLIMMVRIFQ